MVEALRSVRNANDQAVVAARNVEDQDVADLIR